MKRILIAFLFLLISLNLFSTPEDELEDAAVDSQDSISFAIDKMEFSRAISTTWQPLNIDRTTQLFDYAYSLTQPDSLMVSKIFSGYASCYFKIKRYKDAIPHYISSYKHNPSFISALSALGYCYEREEDYKRAREYYKAYLKLADKDGNGYGSVLTRLEVVEDELFWIEN